MYLEDELRLVVAADEAEAAVSYLWEAIEDEDVDYHDKTVPHWRRFALACPRRWCPP
jgi:hypothetical protein